MQCIHGIVVALCTLCPRIPLLLQLLEVVVNVLLELTNGFRGEGVGNSLALAGVLSAVAGIEEAAADGNESVIVFAVVAN